MTKRFMAVLAAVTAVCFADDAPTHTSGNKLAFVIPYLYGTTGLTLPSADHAAHFDSAFQSNFGPVNQALATQIASLPIPSPASGITYTFDRSLGIYTRGSQSLGPIMAERAETIGKDKVAFGFSHQQFTFDSIDGLDLKRLPVLFQHIPNPASPIFARDVITTRNFVDIRIQQTTAYMTYGLTDRIDLSAAMPMVRATMNVISDATIQRVGTFTDPTVHSFVRGEDAPTKQFRNGGSANGIGDVIVRLKGQVIKGEHVGVSLGVDSRLPTGDEYDFLGSGAIGVKPFVALSANMGRFSPHVNVAYQWNGKSVLAGSVLTGEKAQLPKQILYTAGFDIGVTRRWTFAADFLGQRVTQVERVFDEPYRAANGNIYPNIGFDRSSFNASYGSVGFKINAVGNLLATFNVLVRMNRGGLQDRVTPLIGLSYAF